MKTAASGRVALTQKFILVLISVAPSALVFGLPIWPLYALWVALGSVRVRYEDHKVLRDCLWFGIVTSLIFRENITEAIVARRHTLAHDRGAVMVFGSAALLVAIAIVSYLFIKNSYGRGTQRDHLPTGTRPWTLQHPKPFIIPCRTTHTRIFPKHHAFGYDYLLSGFPIVPGGTTPDGVDIPDGGDMFLGRWWLRIHADDYLSRGQASLGFYGKLKVFLREKGVKDNEWSYAYLVTAPRFFGYAFNPASFWYIYNSDHELTRMITEVNNTFGERHLYLLDGSSPTSPLQTPDEETLVPPTSKTTFTDYWTKEFHVSPFNSRKGGGYSQKALNPFPSPDTAPTIDITITLRSSKDHAKIVARLFSTGAALELENLSWFNIIKFIAAWGWVGFMTFPRILKEAYVLYSRRGLHVWFRPEVRASSLGRMPSETECFLQKVFQDYLFYIVHHSTTPFWINYETAIPNKPKEIIATTHRRGREWNVKNLDIRVSTGAFYTRFVHYAHTWEALDRECLITDEKNRTLWISQPALLPLLLPDSTLDQLKQDEQLWPRNYIDELRWTILKKLRCPPAESAYPISPKAVEFEIDDIREHSFSELDRFVRSPSGGLRYAGSYRRAVTKIFLAQRYALGFVEIIDLFDLSLRVTLCWLGISMMNSFAQAQDHSRNITFSYSLCLKSILFGLCHIYGLLKGYK